MASVEATNNAEGEDEIITWLKQNRLSSLCSTIKQAGYIMDDMHAISYDVDDKEIMQSFMAELNITKAIEIARFKQALRKLRDKTQKSQVIKIIVTQDEINAMQRLSDQHKNISNAINNVQTNINKLNENNNVTKKNLNDIFKKLALEINKRHQQLQKDLDSALLNKKNILFQQLDELKLYRQQLSKAKIEYETNIGNKDFDIEDRKKQNLILIDNVLDSNKKYKNQIKSVLSPTILVELNENETIQTIMKWGKITSAEQPSKPVIKVVNNAPQCVKVLCSVGNNDDEKKQAGNDKMLITEYEIEYLLLSKQEMNNMNKMQLFEEKKECIKLSINKIQNDNCAETLINGLQTGETYLFRACSKNIYGLSLWCSPISLLIDNSSIHWKFDWIYTSDNLVKNGKSITRNNGNNWNTIARGPTIPSKFINQKRIIYWSVRIDKSSSDKSDLHFGIAHKDVPASSLSYNQTIGFWNYSGQGMQQIVKRPSFAHNSVVKITVDCQQNIVEFRENNELLGNQTLNVLNKPLNELCFAATLYFKDNKITVM